ncbi:uncharacterized protein LOC116433802 isoform X2 [Nomia melanderi]|uniref:uncharacterized protein LOC116433802 isoform X1 n=1 Tax=Nomia melanderi TaxID=2448451 RepID=UPI0013047472|nr:uncharacterized protein LOC116433802 isoform X1 [Nomia melanderi]XP_031848173.1 uncharacterized protein LOC116433802 isoform X2 [Nomia melanderi]
MSCCKETDKIEQYSCGGCCATNYDTEKKRYLISDPETHFCFCQNNGGCFAYTNGNNNYSNVHNIISTNPEPCQCAEEMMWNCSVPPKPDCKWFNNFSELRRQWSNHARQQNCKCCNCRRR